MNQRICRLSAALIVVASFAARAQAATVPHFAHVYVIVMENHEFTDVIGNPSAPYINSLARQYALGTAYTGVAHPSLPNYMSLTGGETVFTNDCVGCTVAAPNIADEVEASGRSWKAYMEGMPAPCTTSDAGQYTVHHNPFVHYADIVSNASRCASHVVPLSDFTTDLQARTVPDYVWITPNLCSDMHNCSVATGDAWLQSFLPDIMNTPDFSTSVVFLVWDEGTSSIGGGGLVPLLAISPLVHPGFQSSTPEDHYSLLRTIEDGWGLNSLGQSATAAPMSEYFKTFQSGCQDTLSLNDASGTLNMGFAIGANSPATWRTWIVIGNQPYQLWSASIPVVSPAASVNVPIPGFPNLGTVYVVTTLTPTVGTACGDVKGVATGP